MPRPVASMLLVLATMLAACAGAPDAVTGPGEPTTSSVGAVTTTSAPTATTAGSEDPATPTDPTPATPPVSGVDGPPAPPDLVPYAGGNDIDLSQEVLPVYLVFWAEW